LVALSRAELDSSLVFVAFLAFFAALLTLRAVRAPHNITRPVSQEAGELFGASTGALFCTTLVTGQLVSVLPLFLLCITGAAATRYLVHRLSMPGIIWLTATVAGLAISALWSMLFISEMDLSEPFRTLAWVGFGLSVPALLLSQFARIGPHA
jgi:hypothetical protein